MRSKNLVGYGDSFECVANATDTGGSGGLSPCSITLINNTAVYAVHMNDYLPSPATLHLI